MYLAYSANMLNEPISFSDYLRGLKHGTADRQVQEKGHETVTKEFMTKKEVKEFVEKATIELENFTPPT